MTKSPNILLFFPDALRPDVLERDHVCATPNIQRVIDRGLTFARAYTPNPTCSPARASLMTGLLPHNHGVLQVEHCVPDDLCALRSDKPHWAQHLTAAGYRTGYFGKWHIERSFDLHKFGWQVNGSKKSAAFMREASALPRDPTEHLDPERTLRYRGAEGYQEQLYYGVTDVPAAERPEIIPVNLAQKFLATEMNQDAPWCCAVSFWGPNENLICSRNTFEQYDFENIPLPESLTDEMIGQPGLYRRQQRVFSQLSDSQRRMALACYYARVTEIDHQLGRLLDQVEAAGEMDNTLVIVCSDHGRYLGAHGMEGHNFGAFEELYRIPLVMSGPGIGMGETTARVGLHDLCPTLLEYADAPPISVSDSTSFHSLLPNPSASAGDFTSGYAENEGTRFVHTQRVLWDEHWKFVFNGFDEDELYDLAGDPHERKNLAQLPAQQARVRKMQTAMWQRMHETYDKPLVEGHYYTMQFGAVGPDIIH